MFEVIIMNIALSSIFADGSVSQYMKEIRKFPVLSQEEELMLIKKWTKDADVQAAHKLVTSHMRLVVKVALKFRNYGLPLMDVISEGNIGLMKAVKKFRPEKGARLATYAMWWIKAYIQDYIIKSWSMVKIGSGTLQKKLFSNVANLKRQIEETDSKVKNTDSILENSYHVLYLNQKLGDESDDELLDTVTDNLQLDQDELIVDKQEKSIRLDFLKNALSTLNDREQDIIQQRRLSDKAMTLDMLSKKHNVSSERIRQIENAAMQKIKNFAISAI
jgi:RNA polymerase sigma-32 factor